VAPAGATPRFRDPIASDAFDVEVDLTYSHNSVVQDFEIRFPEGISIPWLAGAAVPPNWDTPHHVKGVFRLRLGHDPVVGPERVSVRAGGFFETQGQDPAYANLDFVPVQRLGVTAGGTLRLSAFDIMVGAGHIFGSKLDNHGQGALPAISGNAPRYRTDNTM